MILDDFKGSEAKTWRFEMILAPSHLTSKWVITFTPHTTGIMTYWAPTYSGINHLSMEKWDFTGSSAKI